MATIEKTFQEGEVIIKEGRFANCFYVILEGSVEVVKQKEDREVQLAVLGEHEFFGEMSLLDFKHGMHTATVRALEQTKVAVMSKEDFENYIGHLTPGMRNLLTRLVTRLRETSKKVDTAQDVPPRAAPEQPDEQKSNQGTAEQQQPEGDKPSTEEGSQETETRGEEAE